MEFSTPPPTVDTSQPPPQLTAPSPLATNLISQSSSQNGPNQHPPHYRGHHYQHHHGGQGKQGHSYFKPFSNNTFQRPFAMTQDDFDGKRLRKSVMRKTVDYNASIVKALESRLWQRGYFDRPALQPESIYIPELLPPSSYPDNPSNAVTTRFVKTATNKMRCPIFTLAWTPEGRRLVTGASSGEFTLWNGLTFNFETILQAHDVPVRTMVWSHNDSWMVTGDHAGYVKYWQSNMNNVKMFQAHKEAIRGISFSPTDSKFVSCSDDGTLRIWDFLRCHEERVLRGHGADVKCVHWHPQKGLIISGSKDNQQPIKLWDPKSGSALATLHAHKSTVMDLKWNDNGNWLVTASRDHLLKLFDLRKLKEELQVFRGHKKEASSVSWHPIHEGLFCSGGSDGSVLFWNVGTDKEIGCVETAHDSIVWTLAWHPLGHILCSGSNDHTIKFWTRNRPGDMMRDKYNLNTLPASLAALDDCEYDDAVIPGMGPEDKVEFTESLTADKGFIPGLDLDPSKISDKDKEKKVPYSKPIPRNFQAQWAGVRRGDDTGGSGSGGGSGGGGGGGGGGGNGLQDDANTRDFKESQASYQQLSENTIEGMLASGILTTLDPQAVVGILVYGRFIRVHPDSQLMIAVRQGPDYLNKYIDAGKLDELRDLVPLRDRSRSRSPTLEFRESSPPSKRSRFEPRQHNPQLVHVRELLSLKKPFLPCLLALKEEMHNAATNHHHQQQQQQNLPPPPQQQSWPNPWAVGGVNFSSNPNPVPSPWANGPPPTVPPNGMMPPPLMGNGPFGVGGPFGGNNINSMANMGGNNNDFGGDSSMGFNDRDRDRDRERDRERDRDDIYPKRVQSPNNNNNNNSNNNNNNNTGGGGTNNRRHNRRGGGGATNRNRARNNRRF